MLTSVTGGPGGSPNPEQARAFFEVRTTDGKVLTEPTLWADHLAELSREPTDDCMHLASGVPHWGTGITYCHQMAPPQPAPHAAPS